LDFQKNETEMERLNRLVISYEYKRHEERLNRSGADNQARNTTLNDLKNTAENIQGEINKIDEEKNEVSEKMKQNSSGGSKIRELEKQIKDYSTQSVRLRTKKGLLESSTTDEQKALSLLASQRGEVEV
jgi:structural maintenance of chromosome 2